MWAQLRAVEWPLCALFAPPDALASKSKRATQKRRFSGRKRAVRFFVFQLVCFGFLVLRLSYFCHAVVRRIATSWDKGAASVEIRFLL